MTIPSRKFIITLLVIAGVFIALTWPRDAHMYYEACAPKGDIGELSEAIHGRSFWVHQLENVRGKRQATDGIIANYPAVATANDQQGAAIDRMIDEANAKVMTPAELTASHLRRQADKIEAMDQRRQLIESVQAHAAMLRTCEQLIEGRLGLR